MPAYESRVVCAFIVVSVHSGVCEEGHNGRMPAWTGAGPVWERMNSFAKFAVAIFGAQGRIDRGTRRRCGPRSIAEQRLLRVADRAFIARSSSKDRCICDSRSAPQNIAITITSKTNKTALASWTYLRAPRATPRGEQAAERFASGLRRLRANALRSLLSFRWAIDQFIDWSSGWLIPRSSSRWLRIPFSGRVRTRVLRVPR